MKYVRTKNGKIHISYNDYQGFEKLWVCKKRNTLADFYYVRRSSIVAQADTIEELCDELVVVNNTCFNTPQLLGTEIDKDYYKHEVVYGAIWTDKGLIYVAKMNDKGELELI